MDCQSRLLARILFTSLIGLAILPAYASATRSRVAVAPGRTASVRVSARWITRRMSFTARGLPRGVRATFVVLAAGSLTVRLHDDAAAKPGRYPVGIVAARAPRQGVAAGSLTGRHRITIVVDVVAPKAPAAGSTPAPSAGSTPAPAAGSTPAPSDTATTFTGPVPAHVPTWAYADHCNGGTGAPVALVRQWVSYAESNCGAIDLNVLTDCGTGTAQYCTSVQYVDPNRIYGQGSVPIAPNALESWWLHEPGYSDSQHRLSVSGYGGGFFLNQANPAVDGWFQNFLRVGYNGYDALMVDDTSAALSEELYGSGANSSQELNSNAQLISAHEQLASSLTHVDGSPFVQIDNGIDPNPYVQAPFALLDHPGTVNGVISEGAPISNGTLTPYYSSLLDDMAYIDGTADDFIVLLSYDPSGSLQARRVQAATVLLGYAPGHTVSWSDLEQNSNDLAVWPEQGIVPTDPVQTMAQPGGSGCLQGQGKICASGGHNDLQVAPGVYRREFAACYNQSALIGPCAAIVNTGGAAVTVKPSWLTGTYRHELTMSGGDVQSGGTVNVAGAPFAAGSTTVPSQDALILTS